MKTPEGIKKVLKYCLDGTGCCVCPYRGGPPDICRGRFLSDVREYIQRLEKECAAARGCLIGSAMSWRPRKENPTSLKTVRTVLMQMR